MRTMKAENAPQRRAEAERRIRRALDHIEAAQREIELASQELSSIIGFIPEWTKLGRLYEAVKSHWYRVDAKLQKGRFDLDHDPDVPLRKMSAVAPKDGEP